MFYYVSTLAAYYLIVNLGVFYSFILWKESKRGDFIRIFIRKLLKMYLMWVSDSLNVKKMTKKLKMHIIYALL